MDLMLNPLYEKLWQEAPAAVTIIALAAMFIGGLLLSKLTSKLHLPNVTGYIICGILLGPFVLDLIPETIVEGTEFLADLALAFIAFGTGEFFKFSKLKKNTGKVVVITLAESLLASLFVFILTYGVLRLDLAFSAVLSALASATAPASTMMTIRQTRAKGDFVDTLLQVVAYDDLVALLAYSIAISVAIASLSGEPVSALNILIPTAKNLGVLALGGVFGLLMKLFIQNRQSSDNRLIIAIALLLSFCGVCTAVGVSPLLGCMSMGTVYINLTDDAELFQQLNYFNPPILLLFFVRSGVSFDLESLIHPSGAIGAVPLFWVGIGYFLVRILGKYLGAFLGCLWTGKPKKIRNNFGLALIPQAGVAIGLAALGSRALGGAMGEALETVILSSSVLYELLGPAAAKFALWRSGSYSTKLEDLVEVEETLPAGEKKTSLELLIERIQKIQAELAEEAVNEDEKAFTEAAKEQSSEFGPLP